jgi:CheY-like chemotaxis protein
MKRILLIDDDVMVHKMVDRELCDYDLRVTSIFSGVESLLQLKNRHFDFVFVDNFLGSMMGTEVINAARGIINGTKVYMITGVVEKAQKDIEVSGAKVHGIIDKAALVESMKELFADERKQMA